MYACSVHIGRGQYVPDLKDFAVRVSKAAKLQHQEDELLAEVPDDFLDPIMSTLMTDPVRLPSSKQIVDRSTIARYILLTPATQYSHHTEPGSYHH